MYLIDHNPDEHPCTIQSSENIVEASALYELLWSHLKRGMSVVSVDLHSIPLLDCGA